MADTPDKKTVLTRPEGANDGVLAGRVDAFVRAGANFLTFGLADKAAAKMDSWTGSGTYDENLKKQQAITDYYDQKFSGATASGQVAAIALAVVPNALKGGAVWLGKKAAGALARKAETKVAEVAAKEVAKDATSAVSQTAGAGARQVGSEAAATASAEAGTVQQTASVAQRVGSAVKSAAKKQLAAEKEAAQQLGKTTLSAASRVAKVGVGAVTMGVVVPTVLTATSEKLEQLGVNSASGADPAVDNNTVGTGVVLTAAAGAASLAAVLLSRRFNTLARLSESALFKPFAQLNNTISYVGAAVVTGEAVGATYAKQELTNHDGMFAQVGDAVRSNWVDAKNTLLESTSPLLKRAAVIADGAVDYALPSLSSISSKEDTLLVHASVADLKKPEMQALLTKRYNETKPLMLLNPEEYKKQWGPIADKLIDADPANIARPEYKDIISSKYMLANGNDFADGRTVAIMQIALASDLADVAKGKTSQDIFNQKWDMPLLRLGVSEQADLNNPVLAELIYNRELREANLYASVSADKNVSASDKQDAKQRYDEWQKYYGAMYSNSATLQAIAQADLQPQPGAESTAQVDMGALHKGGGYVQTSTKPAEKSAHKATGPI